MKQETLEEAVERYASKIWDYSSPSEKTLHANCKEAFLKGAKWQQERSYSEEEVLEILYKHTEDLLAGKKITLEEWFEQFKNK